LAHAAAEADEGGDHGRVPQHRRRIGHEEAAVAVEDAEAPGRENQQAGAREQDFDQTDAELPFLAGESGHDGID
jgi:hypothetical protein